MQSITFLKSEYLFTFEDGRVKIDGYDLEAERVAFNLTFIPSPALCLAYALQKIHDCENEDKDILTSLHFHKFINNAQMALGDERERELAAYDEYCPSGILDMLVFDESRRVREIVLRNAKVSPAQLVRAVQTADESSFFSIALSVSKNPNAPGDALKKIVERITDGFFIYDEIIPHPNCPPEILQKIGEEDSPYGVLAVSNPNYPIPRDLTNKPLYFRIGLASNPNTPSEYRKILENDESLEVRTLISIDSSRESEFVL